MHPHCGECGAVLQRGSGFFLGSIYFNYGITGLIIAVAYPLLLFNRIFSERQLLYGALLFVIIFPLWFFRYARSLWLGVDEYLDPRPKETGK